MHLVSKMDLPPMTCLYCGRGNVAQDGEDPDDLRILDLERHVNWGDSAYLCAACVQLAATLYGYATPDDMADKDTAIEKLREQVHDLRATLHKTNTRLAQVTTGLEVRKKVIGEGKKRRKAPA